MNAETILGGVDIIVDGTDNFEARFIVNEHCCRHGVPWVHGGVIGAEGRVRTVLPGRMGTHAAAICGRDAVQVGASAGLTVDLAALAAKLEPFGAVTANPWLVRVEVESGILLSVFADGRAIVAGTRDESKARAIVARYVGA
jgi:molybdopterin/thiamine biosynthesis adenylyltransferase